MFQALKKGAGVAAVIVALAWSGESIGSPVNPQTGQGLTYSAWTPTGLATLNAGTTTSNVALGSKQTAPNQAFVAWVYNAGAVPVNVIVGTDNTIAATLTSGTLVQPGTCVALNANNGAYLAGITAASTATLDINTGFGNPTLACGGGSGGGGGGGSVTQGTVPWVDDVGQWANVNLGAPSNYGTSPGAVAVPGVNAFITNTPTVTANAGTNLNTSLLALETGGNLATLAGAVTAGVLQNNIKQLNGSALGAPSNYGTSPGAVEVPGVNAYVTNTPAVTCSACATSANQTNIQGVIGNATAPADMAIAGGVYNSSPLTLTTGQSAALQVDAKGYLYVDGVGVGQASTTSGQSGSLVMGAATTGNPSYTTAQTDPLSLDLNGGLRVAGEGTAGTATGGVISIQGVASMTPVNVNPVTSNNAQAQPHICSKHAYAHFTTNTDTQIIAASGSTTIYVCDYAFSLNGTTNIYLEKATSGTCATLTQIDQVWYGAANSAKGITNPYYSGLNTGASAQLCVNSSGSSVTGDVSVNYDQY